MEWTKVEDFLPYIMNEVTPCPQNIALQYLRNALIEFCSESWAWNIWTDKETVEAGSKDIYVDVPNQSTPDGLMAVTKNDLPYSLDNIELEYNTVTLGKELEQDSTFQFKLALKPIREAEIVPAWLYEDYLEAVSFGAKYKLASMAGQPWANGELAQYAYNEFRKGVSQAGARKRAKGNTRRSKKVKPKSFIV